VSPGPADDRFIALLDEYGAALRRLVGAYERDLQERDDLMQDIALAIWRALPSFRGDSSERTFIYRIAHNRALSHRSRAMRRGTVIDYAASIEEVADEHTSPSTELELAERRSNLMRCVRRLSPLLRQAIVLSLEGLSNSEIAEVLGTTSPTVAVRLTRGRAALGTLLREREST
jgi:RNA polymerase sigma-70 factor (ECF subfamily)